MATKSVCDVKSCGAIMDGPNLITVGDRFYDLCKKCHDGLKKFQRDYLGEGTDITSLVAKQAAHVPSFQVTPMPSIQILQNPALPQGYWGGVQYYGAQPIPTEMHPSWTVTTGGLKPSDLIGLKTSTVIKTQNNLAQAVQGYMPFIGYNSDVVNEE